ncbi:MAG: FMN-binding protein [Oscillospiraceae bacterium]|nr:FMN-binding protein [Oscillospiraceae bacterium]
MLFLIAILIAGFFSWFCAGLLKKYPGIFYAIGSILTVLMIVLGQMHLQISNQIVIRYVMDLFNKGALACALWCVVAYMGALPNGSAAIKKLMPIRGELSIFSASITVSHAVTYGIVYLQRLFRNSGGDFNFIATCIICALLLIIMIPLTILSFKNIRKKINAKTWKKIQRFAYAFYALIYLHVMLIYVPRARMGRDGSLLSILLYTAVFAGYAVCRIRKAWIKQKKPDNKALLNTICTMAVILMIAGSGMISRATAQQTAIAETSGNSVNSDAAIIQETEFASHTETVPETTETIIESSQKTKDDKNKDNHKNTDSTAETSMETVENSENSEHQETAESGSESMPETVTEAVTENLPAESAIIAENPAPEEPEQEENLEENQNAEPIQEEFTPEPEPDPEPEQNPDPEPEPEIVTIYNNGTFTAEEFGYDSPVTISITIQDDVIIDLTASCNESDMYYFEEAYPVLKNRILQSQSTDGIDAVAGSTYSSNAILNGVRKALESARR